MSVTTPIATPAAAPVPPNKTGILGLSSTESLVAGIIVDFAIGLLVAYLLGLAFYFPFGFKLLFALVIGALLYGWSLNLHKKYPCAEDTSLQLRSEQPVVHPLRLESRSGNYIPPFQRGIVTRLGEVIPSGPDGNGLRSGYHWFPLGEPFYGIFKKQSVKMMTVPFENMQVWTKNIKEKGHGSVEGLVDGLAQFQIEDLAAYNAVDTPEVVLNAIVRESARDVCENNTIEEFLGTENETLADNILEEIKRRILKVPGNLGGRFVSVNVKKTDNRDEEVKKGHAEINVQRSLATSRKTDADARVARINDYKAAGIDPNRAIAADLVADDKTGATITDQRFHGDVGPALEGLTKGLIDKIGGASR